MANTIYNQYKENLITGAAPIANSTDAYGVILVTDSYTPGEGNVWADISGSECADSDYIRQPLAGVTVAKVVVGDGTGTDDYIKVDADDTTFGNNVTISAAGAVIVRNASGGSSPLGTPDSVVTYVDFGGTKSSTAGEFTIVWNTNGILQYKQGTV